MSLTPEPSIIQTFRSLKQNNGQLSNMIRNCEMPLTNTKSKNICDKLTKVTAFADSTGIENKTGGVVQKHHHSVKKEQSTTVRRRNARERTRVMGVNNSFSVLREYVPELKKKCSKVDTL